MYLSRYCAGLSGITIAESWPSFVHFKDDTCSIVPIASKILMNPNWLPLNGFDTGISASIDTTGYCNWGKFFILLDTYSGADLDSDSKPNSYFVHVVHIAQTRIRIPIQSQSTRFWDGYICIWIGIRVRVRQCKNAITWRVNLYSLIKLKIINSFNILYRSIKTRITCDRSSVPATLRSRNDM